MSRRSNIVQIPIEMIKPRSAAKMAIIQRVIQRVTEWRQNPNPDTYQSVSTEATTYHNDTLAKIRAKMRKAARAQGRPLNQTTFELNKLIRRRLRDTELGLTDPVELFELNYGALENERR